MHYQCVLDGQTPPIANSRSSIAERDKNDKTVQSLFEETANGCCPVTKQCRRILTKAKT